MHIHHRERYVLNEGSEYAKQIGMVQTANRINNACQIKERKKNSFELVNVFRSCEHTYIGNPRKSRFSSTHRVI